MDSLPIWGGGLARGGGVCFWGGGGGDTPNAHYGGGLKNVKWVRFLSKKWLSLIKRKKKLWKRFLSSIQFRLCNLNCVLQKEIQQGRNRELFSTKDVPWNKNASINISSKTHARNAPQGKILELFLLDTIKTAF